MNTVLAHDYLSQRGGAERVALEIAKVFKVDRIVTSTYQRDQTFSEFSTFPIQTSANAILKHMSRDPRRALALLPTVWSNMPVTDASVAICSSSGWSHALPTTESTLKVVYCHNTARWIYQHSDYSVGIPFYQRQALRLLTPRLRRWDQKAASTAQLYIANSSSVAKRIDDAYGIDAEVIFPPVLIDRLGQQSAIPRVEPGFFLTVARPRSYKGTETLIHAFNGIGNQRLVVVGQKPTSNLPSNVSCLGRVDESQLRWLYANANALISVSHEDFGLTPIEANSFGTPALLLKAGGFLDSTSEYTSGLFILDETLASIRRAVYSFPCKESWNQDAIKAHADKFSPARFKSRINRAISARLHS